MRSKGRRAGAEQEIIIKRRGRKGHHEEQGGAWKVAFADFTMAMMALFMVLWIIQPEVRIENPAYGDQQSNPLVEGGVGIFDSINTRPIEFDDRHTRRDLDTYSLTADPDRVTADKATPTRREDASADQAEPRLYQSQRDLKELAALIHEVSGQVDALANIEVDVVPQGLRILIKDDQQRFMFARGSARLDPHFHQLLGALSGVLSKVENKLIISGHTDSVPYRGSDGGYNNWNLSGDRALRARNVLVETGLPALNVLQVTAQADVMPLRPHDPSSGANRRIELLLLTSRAERLYRDLFGDGYAAQAHYSEQGARFVDGQRQGPGPDKGGE